MYGRKRTGQAKIILPAWKADCKYGLDKEAMVSLGALNCG